ARLLLLGQPTRVAGIGHLLRLLLLLRHHRLHLGRGNVLPRRLPVFQGFNLLLGSGLFLRGHISCLPCASLPAYELSKIRTRRAAPRVRRPMSGAGEPAPASESPSPSTVPPKSGGETLAMSPHVGSFLAASGTPPSKAAEADKPVPASSTRSR